MVLALTAKYLLVVERSEMLLIFPNTKAEKFRANTI